MSEPEIEQLIKECLKKNRSAQRIFYRTFYGFAMGICLRYASNRFEAAEIMNKGFAKVFTCLNAYNYQYTFKTWLKQVMIDESLDHYHDVLEKVVKEDFDAVDYSVNEIGKELKLNSHDLWAIIHQLNPGYRIIFNLFAIDGYSHEDVAKMINIDPAMSELILIKARMQLKVIVLRIN